MKDINSSTFNALANVIFGIISSTARKVGLSTSYENGILTVFFTEVQVKQGGENVAARPVLSFQYFVEGGLLCTPELLESKYSEEMWTGNMDLREKELRNEIAKLGRTFGIDTYHMVAFLEAVNAEYVREWAENLERKVKSGTFQKPEPKKGAVYVSKGPGPKIVYDAKRTGIKVGSKVSFAANGPAAREGGYKGKIITGRVAYVEGNQCGIKWSSASKQRYPNAMHSCVMSKRELRLHGGK